MNVKLLKMTKKILFIYALFLLTACSNYKQEKLLNEIENRYSTSITSVIQLNQKYYERIHLSKEMYDNYNQDLISKIEIIHKQVTDFYAFSTTFYCDSLKHQQSLQKVFMAYKNTLSSFSSIHLYANKLKNITKGEDFISKKYGLTYYYLTILMMQNDIAIRESQLFSYLLQSINEQGYFLSKIPLKIQPIFCETPNDYSFNLCSSLLTRNRYRIVYIDSIKKEGNPVSINYTIERVYGFKTIRFDSLPKGNYKIKGEVRSLDSNSNMNKPFIYIFQIK
jgi:hypothetical protein